MDQVNLFAQRWHQHQLNISISSASAAHTCMLSISSTTLEKAVPIIVINLIRGTCVIFVIILGIIKVTDHHTAVQSSSS